MPSTEISTRQSLITSSNKATESLPYISSGSWGRLWRTGLKKGTSSTTFFLCWSFLTLSTTFSLTLRTWEKFLRTMLKIGKSRSKNWISVTWDSGCLKVRRLPSIILLGPSSRFTSRVEHWCSSYNLVKLLKTQLYFSFYSLIKGNIL